MTEPVASLIVSPKSAGAGSGVRWWADSVPWLFGDISRLGTWIGMSLCLVLILIALQWIPFFGWIAAHLLWFVFSGGLMLAAQTTERGQSPRFGDLFSGFGPKGGALVGAGLLILVATAAVVGLMLAVGLGAFLSALWAGASLADYQTPPLAALGLGWGSALLLLVCVFLFVPISMAAWLAPALIMLRGANPVDALRMSLAACRANLGALTVYGLAGLGLAIVAAITFIGWLFVLPLVFLSTYAAFRELFPAAVEVLDVAVDRPS